MTTPFHPSRRGIAAGALLAGLTPMTLAAATPKNAAAAHAVTVLSKTVTVDGLEIFYREAGPADAPVVLLLHGFPSSSHMFRDLIPLLAGRYRVLAPDYPGFGYSAAPPLGSFPYTFAAMAGVIGGFARAVGADRYVLYMQDYGGPVGFRLASSHPERVRGLVVQNAVAHVEGWNPEVVQKLAPYWQNRNAETEKPVRDLLRPETTKFQYTHGASRIDRLSPDAWLHDQALLDRPGNDALQLEMLFNYQDNVAQYPKWGEYLATGRPPVLVVWGRNDPFFTADGAAYFRRQVPGTEIVEYDAGHFALETHAAEIADRSLAFLDRLAK